VEQNRNYYLQVRGKGSDRPPHAGAEGLPPLAHLHRARPAEGGGEHTSVLVPSPPAERSDYEPLTTSGVDQMIRNVAEKAGITKRVYPHLPGHSFAMAALARGMNPIQLAQILGHSSLTMIQAVYSHLSSVDAYAAILRSRREEDSEAPLREEPTPPEVSALAGLGCGCARLPLRSADVTHVRSLGGPPTRLLRSPVDRDRVRRQLVEKGRSIGQSENDRRIDRSEPQSDARCVDSFRQSHVVPREHQARDQEPQKTYSRLNTDSDILAD
jgi:hypothetical protein